MSSPGPGLYERLSAAAEAVGLAVRGGLTPGADELAGQLAPEAARTVVLLGFTGGRQWPVFRSSAEYADGAPHALDRWSRRVIEALAASFSATGLYPSDGPPWLPFQRWAQRAEPLAPSPLGILIHPRYGLWHAYRGALAFSAEVAVPAPVAAPSPCSTCVDKPCLSACPVGAVTALRFDVAACSTHVRATTMNACRTGGCLARYRCPVGVEYRYGAEQAAFHMAAFVGRDLG